MDQPIRKMTAEEAATYLKQYRDSTKPTTGERFQHWLNDVAKEQYREEVAEAQKVHKTPF